MTAFYYLHGSYPNRQGRLIVTGLQARVEIDRELNGLPTLTGQSSTDLSFALGFVHAQDRFFSMDLVRRYQAGTLGAFLGQNRPTEPVRPAFWQQHLLTLPSETQRLLAAYTRGVNAALKARSHAPIQYLYLRRRAEPWQDIDSLRVLAYYKVQAKPLQPVAHAASLRAATKPTWPPLADYPVRLAQLGSARNLAGLSLVGTPTLAQGWSGNRAWLGRSSQPTAESADLNLDAGPLLPDLERLMPVSADATGQPSLRTRVQALTADQWPADWLFPDWPVGAESPSIIFSTDGAQGHELTSPGPLSRHWLRPWQRDAELRIIQSRAPATPQSAFQLDLLPQREPLFNSGETEP